MNLKKDPNLFNGLLVHQWNIFILKMENKIEISQMIFMLNFRTD